MRIARRANIRLILERYIMSVNFECELKLGTEKEKGRESVIIALNYFRDLVGGIIAALARGIQRNAL
jgi:hypothetical protein